MAQRLLWLLILVGACRSPDPFDQTMDYPTPVRGAVVSEHPLATEVGVRILEQGGNAADAAVATALALAVVYPQAGNLGGGGFAVWAPHVGEPASYDFREMAPAGYGTELYLNAAGQVVAERSLSTPLAVGVPGSPAGLFELYRRHGSKRLSFPELCEPAIDLARDGFRVDPWLARALREGSASRRLRKDPAAHALFYPDDEPLREGDLLRLPKLARTLRTYARSGPTSFYRGDVASSIVSALEAADRRSGGVTRGRGMSLEDLAAYTVVEREPLVGWFRGSEIISMGPPSSGGFVLLQVLSILEGFPLDARRNATLNRPAELGVSAPDDGSGVSALAVHWWIEAMRRAFADRAEHLGDPDDYDVPVDRLLSPEWIAERRISIGERADPGRVEAMPLGIESEETTHLSVVDRDGNAVSLTTTLNGTFGSGILVPDRGFLLNNELDDFSILAGTPNMYGLVGSDANQLRPGRRPLSSMTPTIVRDGGRRVSLALGSPGGPRIITAVIQVLLRVLVYEQELASAVAAPRLHQQWSPQATRFESGWPEGLLEALRNYHGQLCRDPEDGTFASVQAIWIGPDAEPVGVSDPRRGGVAGIEGRPIPRPRRPGQFFGR